MTRPAHFRPGSTRLRTARATSAAIEPTVPWSLAQVQMKNRPGAVAGPQTVETDESVRLRLLPACSRRPGAGPSR